MAEQDSAAEEEGWSSCSAEQRVCAPVSPVQSGTAVAAGDAPGTSVRCQLKELLCEASGAGLALVTQEQSR